MWDWDEAKRQTNLAKHGVDFDVIGRFEWDTAQTEPDRRFDYGEDRLESIGHIGDRLYVVVYTPRGTRRRLISLRKANSREVERWHT
jgi:uncharacterized DUF497 family protein